MSSIRQKNDAVYVDGERVTAADLQLLSKAVSQGWNITPKMRDDALRFATGVLADDMATTYHKLAAGKLLTQMDGLNTKKLSALVTKQQAESGATLTDAISQLLETVVLKLQVDRPPALRAEQLDDVATIPPAETDHT